MPWDIKSKYGGCKGYAVVNRQTSKVVGCHETLQKAKSQLAALNINVKDSETMQNSEELVYGFWNEIRGISLNESQWFRALPVGIYNHPMHGSVVITPDSITRYATNINNNVRGSDLDIDYDHKEFSGKAAGWIIGAEARPDGLYIKVDWTTEAEKVLAAREYRYFSPEFAETWIHPKTGKTFRDVMFGGALTNRPFLKDLAPINASEVVQSYYFSGEDATKGDMSATDYSMRSKEDGMDELLAKLGEVLELSEPSSDAIIKAMQGVLDEKTVVVKKLSELTTKLDEATKRLSELEAADKEEANVKAFSEQYPEQAQQLVEMKATQLQAEANEAAIGWVRCDESKLGLPPALVEDAKTLHIAFSETGAAIKFNEFMDSLVSKGLVDYSETGSASGAKETDTHDADSFAVKAQEIADEKSIKFVEAIPLAQSKYPEEFKAYNKAQTSLREVS